MNLFEDLVDELKDEHLLEETVIETKKIENNHYPAIKENERRKENSFAADGFLNEENRAEKIFSGDFAAPLENFEESLSSEDQTRKQLSEKEFYRKRAMEEVASLQMVEHVISGVEREQMKVASQTFDDLAAKKSLHAFLQISEDVKSQEHIQAESALMRETENWCSALSYRDKRISIAHLRRYCETTRPVLSSQALISLARFYRNLPYSESIRNKFDLVITRLFAKEIGGEKRFLVFNRGELAEHLHELYAEWESIRFYSDEENAVKIREMVFQFNEFIDEAENAESFDRLIETDLFTRLRNFKEKTQEMFFAPQVAAAAVDCNIRIGNSYVELIEEERNLADAEVLQDRYGFLHDQAISDATSKTLQLVDLLREKNSEIIEAEDEFFEKPVAPVKETEQKSVPKSVAPFFNFAAVNRKLMILTIAVCLLCGGLYVWANYLTTDVKVSANVQKINLENSPLKNYLQSAQITADTYYGDLLPEWENLPLDKRQEILKALHEDGKNKGYTKVVLIDRTGNNAGFADGEKLVVNKQ